MTKLSTLPAIESNKSGYIVVIAGALVVVITGGLMYSFGVFFKPILTEFGWTREATSGAYSLNTFIIGFFGIMAGRLSDRFGPRLVVSVTGLFLGLGFLLMSQISDIPQLYIFYGVLVGIGMSCWVPVISTVARRFVKRRGLMCGIVASGVGIGTMVMPPLANYLISNYTWRTCYIIVGLMGLVIMVVAAQFLRHGPAQKSSGKAGVGKTETSAVPGFSLQEAMRTRQFWMITLLFFFFGFMIHTIMVHIVPHATDTGVSPATAAVILSAIGGTSVVGKVGLGSVADRIGSKANMIIAAILLLIAFLWLQLAGELWMLYPFAVLFALGYGGYVATQAPITAQFFGLRAHGAILGIFTFSLTIGGATGPLLAGRIFDATSSYRIAFFICAGLGAIALIIGILLKPVRGRDTRPA